MFFKIEVNKYDMNQFPVTLKVSVTINNINRIKNMHMRPVTFKYEVHINLQVRISLTTENPKGRENLSKNVVHVDDILSEKGELDLTEETHKKIKQAKNNKVTHSKTGNPNILKDDIVDDEKSDEEEVSDTDHNIEEN